MVIAYYISMVLFLIVCVILTMLILIQKGRGGGLSGAFGGAGGNTAFGSKTGDVLTWATSVGFGVFIAIAIAMNLFADQIGHPPTAPGITTPAAIPGAAGTPTTPTPTVPTNSPPNVPIGQ